MKDVEALARFGLTNGQYFSEQQCRNLHWFLGEGRKIGFGDLRASDIIRIQEELRDEEMFEGYQESHWTRHMNRENPVVRITKADIEFPEPVKVSPETRRKVFLEENYGA